MAKIATHDEEARGNLLMEAWNGNGAAPVLGRVGNAILMPRAEATPNLTAMSDAGDDDGAVAILCATASSLHAAHGLGISEKMVPLERWFDGLRMAGAADDGSFFGTAWGITAPLIAARRDEVVLHGDIHHGNVLHFGTLGWRAIDPKGLIGDRAFDYANLFCNPSPAIAEVRFEARLAIVTGHAGLERDRLLRWIVAWTGLSAVWFAESGGDASLPLAIGHRALAKLDGGGAAATSS